MKKIPLNKESLQSRLSYIEDSLKSLERFRAKSFDEFHKNPDNFRIAYFDLHRALEAAMDIGSHILSRIPGARATSYREIPVLLGKNKIVPLKFANKELSQMAGYRNRMVHFYSEISEKELYRIIQENLRDFEKFCFYINRLIQNPEKVGLTIK
jgi:uncharacterized protein YutE (UPF0331/DUF86 family)